jgi:nicotinamide mononucleotide (NMN) deamidase PncC
VERTTVHDLDVVLWRACAIGVLVVVGDAIAIARTGVAAPEGIEAERTP